MATSEMEGTLGRLLLVLVHIQAKLDQDLSVERLAKVADWSPFHFHRRFRSEIGETVKQYTRRLRLERAAVQLTLLDSTVLDIALACGFESHDGFTRAFKKRFGSTPKDYRIARRLDRVPGSESDDAAGSPQGSGEGRPKLQPPASCYQLSATKIRRMEPQHVAFIRHVGPYESVSDRLWAELDAWALERMPDLPRIFLGIAQDPPGITAPENQRFDAAIRVGGPFRAEGHIGHQVLDVGEFAATTHVGHFSTLPKAYGEIVSRLLGHPKYKLLGVPTIEIYHTSQVNQDFDLNHTEIFLPVTRVRS